MSSALKAAILALTAGSFVLPSMADVKVEINKTTPLTLSEVPGSIVIGNPQIADVAVAQGDRIFITGKAFGTTNLIVYDPEGKQMFRSDVQVTSGSDNLVTLARGGEQVLLDCAPNCVGEISN